MGQRAAPGLRTSRARGCRCRCGGPGAVPAASGAGPGLGAGLAWRHRGLRSSPGLSRAGEVLRSGFGFAGNESVAEGRGEAPGVLRWGRSWVGTHRWAGLRAASPALLSSTSTAPGGTALSRPHPSPGTPSPCEAAPPAPHSQPSINTPLPRLRPSRGAAPGPLRAALGGPSPGGGAAGAALGSRPAPGTAAAGGPRLRTAPRLRLRPAPLPRGGPGRGGRGGPHPPAGRLGPLEQLQEVPVPGSAAPGGGGAEDAQRQAQHGLREALLGGPAHVEPGVVPLHAAQEQPPLRPHHPLVRLHLRAARAAVRARGWERPPPRRAAPTSRWGASGPRWYVHATRARSERGTHSRKALLPSTPYSCRWGTRPCEGSAGRHPASVVSPLRARQRAPRPHAPSEHSRLGSPLRTSCRRERLRRGEGCTARSRPRARGPSATYLLVLGTKRVQAVPSQAQYGSRARQHSAHALP